MEIFIVLGAIFVLLLFSAFFSGSETALTAASRPLMHSLEQQGNARARTVNRLFQKRERLIGTILLGNNLVNILASAIATSLLIGLFGDAGVAYATAIMTLLVLLFAEVLPKTYAIQNAERSALAVAPIIRVIVYLFTPFTVAIQAIVRWILRLFGITDKATLGSEFAEEELRGAIELHVDKLGEEVRDEQQMLRSVLDLDDVDVEEIMTHRKSVVLIDVDQPPAKIIEEMLPSPYTRIPLYRDDPDNIVGVLHAKALFRAVQEAGDRLDELDILALASEPWFIPESTDLLSQLQAFRSRHEHFAIVVDEYGEVLGIVTLEDILEEIVGEIEDEHDIEVVGVKMLDKGELVVDGSVTIRDLNRNFDWRLPDEEAVTVAGLILHEARRIPEVGQVFLLHGFRFEILERQRNQVTSIKITPLDETQAQGVTKTPEPEATP